jgi:hypothetical protein
MGESLQDPKMGSARTSACLSLSNNLPHASLFLEEDMWSGDLPTDFKCQAWSVMRDFDS